MEIEVRINGKKQGTIQRDETCKDDIFYSVQKAFSSTIGTRKIIKQLYVPDKMVNIVVK